MTCYDISKRQIKDHKRLKTYLVNRGSEGRKVWYDLESSKFSEDHQRCWVARLKFVSMLSRLSLSKGIALDLKSQIAISKKIHSIKSPTIPPSLLPTFPFLPPPYNFVPISPSSLVFWTISPFSLFCSSPLFLMLRYLRHLWLFLLSMAN